MQRSSAEFRIISAVIGPVDGLHCRKLPALKETAEVADSEEELELRRQLRMEALEEQQRALFPEMLGELVDTVKQMRRERAKKEREEVQRQRDALFKEQMRQKKLRH